VSNAVPVHLPAPIPEGAVTRVLYAHALNHLSKENSFRWGVVATVFGSRPNWWRDRFIAHSKRMADKGIPNAVELVAKVTALRTKM
jgi:hypothetical protein